MSGQMSGAMTGSATSTAHGMSGSSHGTSGSAAPGAASAMSGHQPADVGQISANDETTAVTCADMPCAGDHDPLTPCIVMLMCAIAALVLSLLLPRSGGRCSASRAVTRPGRARSSRASLHLRTRTRRISPFSPSVGRRP